jgi:putative FmdB family regulatory protein
MPTYTYKCSECNHQFDIKQRITDEKLIHCPECQEDTLERVIGANPVIFKGDGWADNYAKGKYHEK